MIKIYLFSLQLILNARRTRVLSLVPRRRQRQLNFGLRRRSQRGGVNTFCLGVKTFRALFTNFLAPGLTRELCSTLDDWLESTSPTNHPAVYVIRELIREFKSW